MIGKNYMSIKAVNNIEFKMIRKNDKCWIKATPLVRVSNPSSIYLILNNEQLKYDIYDENGIESYEFYFEGFNCNPSLYLKSKEKNYRIDFKKDVITATQIKDAHNQDDYIKKYCNFKSTQSSCWAKAVYYTSRPDKSPFNEM